MNDSDSPQEIKGAPDNIIVQRPLEFRWSDWQSGFFMQMTRKSSAWLEEQRHALHAQGKTGVAQLPPHHSLQGSMVGTIGALFAYRHDEEKMRKVYYLAGVVDCLINQVNPVLRTAMLRDMYNKVARLKNELGVKWAGPLDQVLLPIDGIFFNEMEYKRRLATAETLKALYGVIEEGTQEMFDILSHEYVFYCPYRKV